MVSRRWLLGGGAALSVIGFSWAVGGRSLYYASLTEEVAGAQISATEAHRRLTAGEILLVDIRRPDEWARTGTADGAIRLDMRREDFAEALLDATGGDRGASVALICARGVRSARLANQLSAAGFEAIIDVPEGMLGSPKGAGWIAERLPLDHS